MRNEVTSVLTWLGVAYDNNDLWREGLAWYDTANKFAAELAAEFDLTLDQAAGVIAALSPQKRWDENQRIARLFCETGYAAHTGCQTAKATACITATSKTTISRVLGGLKTRCFYDNIARPTTSEHITIDRWAIRAAGWDRNRVTPNQYAKLESVYRKTTERWNKSEGMNLRPLQVQAIVWCAIREY